MILAVDLAARYSAAVLMDDTAAVVWQADSWYKTETEFVANLTFPWTGLRIPPEAMIVEDLPHRLPFAALVKHVCRIQGRIIERMARLGVDQDVMFVPPAEWRKAYDGLGRGTGPDAVVGVAGRLGYQPPDLTPRCIARGDKAIARKVATDYCAAFLIARWALHMRSTTGAYDTEATSRYAKQAA